jgi:hypothetical protein
MHGGAKCKDIIKVLALHPCRRLHTYSLRYGWPTGAIFEMPATRVIFAKTRVIWVPRPPQHGVFWPSEVETKPGTHFQVQQGAWNTRLSPPQLRAKNLPRAHWVVGGRPRHVYFDDQKTNCPEKSREPPPAPPQLNGGM